jgi:hypothetical protein
MATETIRGSQRPDWLRMQSEANRSRGRISLQFAILQGDFQKLQGEPIRFLSDFAMVSKCCKEVSLPREQGAFFDIAGKSSVGLRMVAGLAQFPLRTRRPQ